MVNSFVTPKDIQTLTSILNSNPKHHIEIFLVEIRRYLNQVWSPEDQIQKPLKSLAELNETYLLCYPSTGGYHILDSSFTGPDCPIELLSEASRGLLGYFYGIQLR